MHCEQCKAKIEKPKHNQRFCSRRCKNANINKRHLAEIDPIWDIQMPNTWMRRAI